MAGIEQVKGKPQGRRKIPIEKIADKAKKQVTFSKRRKGIFNKASELCSLCNAKIAVITFSGAGKIFSFGHPSIDEIVNRYLHGSTTSLEDSLDNVNGHLSKEMLNVATCNHDLFWWEKPVEGLGLEELEQYMVLLKELRNHVASKVVNNKKDGSVALSLTPQFGLDLNKEYNPLSNDHIPSDAKGII